MSSRGAGMRAVNLAVYGTPKPPTEVIYLPAESQLENVGEPAPPRRSPRPIATPAGAAVTDSGLAKLNAIVPAEALGLYVALIGIVAAFGAFQWKDQAGDPFDVSPIVFWASWVCVAFGIAVAIFATYLPVRNALLALQGSDRMRATRNIVVRCVVMPLLFIALIIAQPANVILQSLGLDSAVGIFIAAAVGVIAGAVQKLLTYTNPAPSPGA